MRLSLPWQLMLKGRKIFLKFWLYDRRQQIIHIWSKLSEWCTINVNKLILYSTLLIAPMPSNILEQISTFNRSGLINHSGSSLKLRRSDLLLFCRKHLDDLQKMFLDVLWQLLWLCGFCGFVASYNLKVNYNQDDYNCQQLKQRNW